MYNKFSTFTYFTIILSRNQAPAYISLTFCAIKINILCNITYFLLTYVLLRVTLTTVKGGIP